jgi:hypothetical protein
MLDEIKKDLEWGKKVGGKPQENLDMEQVEWLIKQTEKAKQVEKILLCGDYDSKTKLDNINDLFFDE